MISWIKNLYYNWQKVREYKKRIKELRKKDPFIY
jgi:hypothetical protein